MAELSELSDEDLYLSWHQIGNSDALWVLLERWSLKLPWIFYRKKCSEEERKDLIHNVLKKIMISSSYRGEGNFRAWVTTIANNEYNDHCRKEGARRKVEGEVGLPPTPPAGYAELEVIDEMMEFLKNYPNRKKSEVFERHLDGWSNKRISEEFDISEETVGQYISIVKMDIIRFVKGK